MTKTTENSREYAPLSLGGQTLFLLFILLSGASVALGAIPAVIGAVFAAALLALLLLRGNVAVACLSAGMYTALVFLFATAPAFVLSLGVVLGGGALARSVRGGEDRGSQTLTVSFILILTGVVALLFSLYSGMTAAGKSDLLLYLREQMDGMVAATVSEYENAMEMALASLAATNPELAESVKIPSHAELNALFTQIYSFTPAFAVLFAAAFSILATYLLQLFSMLTDERGKEPLYSAENRGFSLGVLLSVSYIVTYLINLFWRDYASVISLVLMNAQTVFIFLFAFGGLRYIPRILHGMRRLEGGRPTYLIWFVLFLLLCLCYLSHALFFLGMAHAISILKNAIRFHRGTDKKG